MNAKIEKLKERAQLWRQKADQLISSAMIKAEYQAESLSAKGDMLQEQEEAKGAERSDMWRERNKPFKAEAVLAKSIADGRAKNNQWKLRAEVLLLKAKESSEIRARLLREKADALDREVAHEEARVQRAQQDAFNEETRNNR